MPILKLLLLSLVFILIAVLALSVRLFFNKKTVFKGGCASHANVEDKSAGCCCAASENHSH